MSQNIQRLKQLLFEAETVALDDLSKRIAGLTDNEAKAREELGRRLDLLAETDKQSADELRSRIAALSEAAETARKEFQTNVESMADLEAKARSELSARLDSLHARTGDDERLTASVAEIIGEALRRAEVVRHVELSQSIAPLVVTTIKTELRNSQDEMVEALYPITGRLVKAYVASAIKDLTEEINRRLEQNPVMLRVQSLATGRPVSELALAGTHDFAIEDLYLIRRGTGELVAHWPETATSGRDQIMSGVLAAINEFASEALSADQSSLREIDLGGEQVYLRASPIYLLAARCSGQAPKPIAQALDDAFLSAVESQHAIDNTAQLGQDTSVPRAAALAEVGESLRATVSEKLGRDGRSGGLRTLKVLAAVILLPILGWVAWSYYTDFRVARIRTAAQRVIAADTEMTGYPMEISVAGSGSDLIVMGLAPSQAARARIVQNLNAALPEVALHERINVVEMPDVTPELTRLRDDLKGAIADVTRTAWQQSNATAETRLDQATADLKRALPAISDAAVKANVKRISEDIGRIRTEFAPLAETARTVNSPEKAAEDIPAYRKLAQRLDALSGELLAIVGVPEPGGAESAVPSDDATIDGAINRFAAASDRIAAVASTAAAANAMRPPPPKIVEAAPPPPREVLRTWTRDHAIFFSDELEYRNPAEADELLAALAAIMKQKPGVLRVVGYTDETGTQTRNDKLAHERASKVFDDLIARGVEPDLLVVVGRAAALDLSDARGTSSPNRRVQFEIAFEGEYAQ